MAIRDAMLEGSENFNHLVVSNMLRHHTLRGPFRLRLNASGAAGIKVTTFRPAAEHYTYGLLWLELKL